MNKSSIVSFIIYITSIHAFGVEYKCDTIVKKPIVLLSCSTWFNNGNLESVYNQKDGKFEGVYKSWYKNGQVENNFIYVNGCLSDSSFSFFENGHIQLIAKNTGCNRRGWSISFFENGDTASISSPQSFKSFYKMHIIRTKQFFNENNKKHGLCESWREDGTRKDSTVYRNDTIIEMREYYTSGKVRQWFKKCLNASFDEAYFYHPDGKNAGRVIKGYGIVTGYTETADRKFTDRYENGTLVESKEVKN